MRSPALPRLAAVAAGLLLAVPALAAPRLSVSITQLREVVETKDGVRTARMVPATSVTPGEVVEYVLAYENRGDAAAKDANIDDPIPKGTTYLAGSATGEGAEITFSADG